jgi:hypothetical protein
MTRMNHEKLLGVDHKRISLLLTSLICKEMPGCSTDSDMLSCWMQLGGLVEEDWSDCLVVRVTCALLHISSTMLDDTSSRLNQLQAGEGREQYNKRLYSFTQECRGTIYQHKAAASNELHMHMVTNWSHTSCRYNHTHPCASVGCVTGSTTCGIPSAVGCVLGSCRGIAVPSGGSLSGVLSCVTSVPRAGGGGVGGVGGGVSDWCGVSGDVAGVGASLVGALTQTCRAVKNAKSIMSVSQLAG